MTILNNPNASVILDMNFGELIGVNPDYVDPETVPEIQWIVKNSSFICKHNGESGVYDYIFNLSMIDSYISSHGAPSLDMLVQLQALERDGYSYILFNQGC